VYSRVHDNASGRNPFDLRLGPPIVFRKYHGGLICMNQLAGAITRAKPAQQPDDRRLFEGEWYCEDERCEVREVQTSFKFLGKRPRTMPPRLRCPLCGEPLKFHHYLIDETFIREDAAGDVKDEADPPSP
jgi:hypothetical protein